MATLHVANPYNIKYSIINYFIDQLAAITPPAILGSYTTPVDEPEAPITPPAISFFNIPAGSRYLYQGNRVSSTEKGARSFGILDASAWAAREAIQWSAQLDIMQAMVEQVAIDANNGIAVYDFAASPTMPPLYPYLIRIIETEVVQTAPDPNPDLERRRILVSYFWTQRVTA